MAHSFWIILAFIPAMVIFSILYGYNRWILGITFPKEARKLQDYSTAEIVYAFFAALTIIASFLGGMMLLNRFEPVTAYFAYGYLILLSLPLTGAALGHYAEIRHQKEVGFQTVTFTLFLLPTLLVHFAFAYNGFGDEMAAQTVPVTVIDKRIQINKGGGTPIVKIEALGKARRILHRPREMEVSKTFYTELQVGDEISLTIKPGALGIPWLENLIIFPDQHGQQTILSPNRCPDHWFQPDATHLPTALQPVPSPASAQGYSSLRGLS